MARLAASMSTVKVENHEEIEELARRVDQLSHESQEQMREIALARQQLTWIFQYLQRRDEEPPPSAPPPPVDPGEAAPRGPLWDVEATKLLLRVLLILGVSLLAGIAGLKGWDVGSLFGLVSSP